MRVVDKKRLVAELRELYKEFASGVKEVIEEAENIRDFYVKLEEYHRETGLKRMLREKLQDVYRIIADEYKLPRIPIYISDKYKLKKKGLFFYSLKKTRGIVLKKAKGIVLFYLVAARYNDIRSMGVEPWIEFFSTFLHEVAHVVEYKEKAGVGLGHGRSFKEIFEKLKKEWGYG